MAEVTQISIVNGIPTGGTGEVPTLASVRDVLTATTATAANQITQTALLTDLLTEAESTSDVTVVAGATEYETVAASQTAQVLGTTGAIGDRISGILVIPATVSPGLVTLLDLAISIPLFVGGSASVSNLIPFYIPLDAKSVSGAWKLTTGANVSCVAFGNFT